LPLVGFDPPLLSLSVPPRLRGPSTESSSVSDHLNCVVRGMWLSPVQRPVPRRSGHHRQEPRTTHHSPFRELEPLPRSRPPRLLALHHARIARQQSLLPQLLAVLLVRQAQRPRDREPQRTRLPRHPPAPAQ